ncbi:MAG: alpha-mannosidase [Clostridia bacterium]|nr:alpha-mannosidase [Clostridia bacterium]
MDLKVYDKRYRKITRYIKVLDELRWYDVEEVSDITFCPCEYKKGHTPPPASEFEPFTHGDFFGNGWDTHAWFHFTVDRKEKGNDPLFLRVCTEQTGWDAANPQFIVYVDGALRQGMDTNHRELLLGRGGHYDIFVYGYTGAKIERAQFFADSRRLAADVDGLYYDLLYPYQMAEYLDLESSEFSGVMTYMDRAVSMLDLFDTQSEAFHASVLRAREYLETEFYGKYCHEQDTTTVCIGHTHIDCAWKWTLLQTREKVQRSFATVLELMNRYPEYKFMSSQALLYKNLKEEAPALYEQVKKRIAEGRWECEGAMWVEADCNLSSGESLVRQVLYGKKFFKQEFGVDNRELWLPDVFGYSAALPQILRKCGVDWFVTSKISWNDVNRMPHDTFIWRGIDGTEINTHFLTAQDASRQETKNRTTYVSHITAQKIAGAYKRYSDKNLTNEAINTFGFGDGGGGPTSEDMELGRRGARGIPGSPNVKIEFAGDFLGRLEKKMENNPEVAHWQGELYLEYHRGTYTTMAYNKKNNRKCEFLYQNAEWMGVVGEQLLGEKFPAQELHDGWEDILTNQFHDIIPGSSIKEVYDQCMIDYPRIIGIGERIVSDRCERIANGIDKKHGYVVFNPNSFEGKGTVKIGGKSAYVSGVPSKGWLATNDFVTENHVKINGKTVETDRLTVQFNDAWQIVSIYDKENDREVLKAGAIGNELRVYADYPDKYDAWEWTEYTREHEYRTITEVSSVETVEDGARRGVRITRPYEKSTVEQTLWFTDCSALIEIENRIDWHQVHHTLRATFPVEINADKATYEIQFGTIERPTHANTSWDRAKFEVCAHKYADLSEGGYGVSLLNDCKYGHDIHNGEITLTLLRSPTDPNPEADQGEHTFTYALYPHAGSFAESDTVQLAYMLNNPMTAIAATGEADTIPTSYSAVSIDRDNVICETVKAAEDGDGTVIRFYETKNCRGKVKVTLGIPVEKAYLCDLMENELEEISVVDGALSLKVSPFEIVTLKVK